MLLLASLLVLGNFIGPSLSYNATFVIESITTQEWQAFNQSVGGKLRLTQPLAEPCFGGARRGGCSRIQESYNTAGFQTSHFGTYVWSNFATCMATLETCSLRSSATPVERTAISRTCNIGNMPAAYIEVRSVKDVQSALAFVKRTKIPLVVKNSGHDHKGRSSGVGALALWMERLKQPMRIVKGFIPEGCASSIADAVTFSTGEDFDALVKFMDGRGYTVVAGSSATVRPGGGWMTGGGHSALATTLGLGVDNILQIKAVFPDGQYLTANRCKNQDLFFALRGGGGNAFGIVMEVAMRAHPHFRTQALSGSVSATSAPQLRRILEVIAAHSNEWAAKGWGGTIGVGLQGAHHVRFVLENIRLDNMAARRSMRALSEIAPTLTIAEHNTYYSSWRKISGGGGKLGNVGVAMSSRLLPSNLLTKADTRKSVVDAMARAAELVSGTGHRNLITTVSHYPLEFLLTTPAMYNYSRNPSDAASITPAWRSATWHIVIKQGFENQASKQTILNAYKTVSSAVDLFRRLTPGGGAYVNEADLYEPHAEDSFWGKQNYQRLLGIKKKIDPDNLLTCWGCVGWNPSDPQFGCYPKLLTG